MIYQYTTCQHDIIVDSFSNLSQVIYFFGDVHFGTKSHDEERFDYFLSRARKDDGALFFGLGDYMDFASLSENKKISGINLHDTTMDKFDEIAEQHNRAFAAKIAFMRGRLLGLVGGNHQWKMVNGKLSDEDLAERLGTRYMGWLCHFTLKFRREIGNNQSTIPVHIVACHGRAGGKTAGITITQVDDLRRIMPAADIYVMGHDHQRGAVPQSVLMPYHNSKTNEYELKQKRQFLCRSGSFKKAYMEGERSYEVSRLLKPADLGALKITINIHRKHRGTEDRIITDIEAMI